MPSKLFYRKGSENISAIGKRIRSLRICKGISMKELSIRTGVLEDVISNIEEEENFDPYISDVLKLSEYFHISPDEFRNQNKTSYIGKD